ncbi:hypothetical protein GCM10027073_43840 [Streptomyces chlorus]|uniref:Transposase n=1 Tax=Streptomyces chlorus TaxID=887452 RepID=A0ABW1E5J5_9ACTN
MGSKYTKRYSDEYKRDAIELVRSSGRTVTDVARELGISSESLRGWVKKAKAAEAGGDTASARGSTDARGREVSPAESGLLGPTGLGRVVKVLVTATR